MRGKHRGLHPRWLGERNIPAHAGKTRPRRLQRVPGKEHPRACGENALVSVPCFACEGTSPRMRGKPPQRLRWPCGLGNIPAHAGKTPAWPGFQPSRKEHPRACGENTFASAVHVDDLGTSPRMRGKRRRPRYRRWHRGNIPAHAGKTVAARPGCGKSTEHPRACGENPVCKRQMIRPRGTSPRMRGKLIPGAIASSLEGNIPAHAGKTSLISVPFITWTEHPRACGENFKIIIRLVNGIGTSPRMRGKPS